jgi:hypothetical protein
MAKHRNKHRAYTASSSSSARHRCPLRRAHTSRYDAEEKGSTEDESLICVSTMSMLTLPCARARARCQWLSSRGSSMGGSRRAVA